MVTKEAMTRGRHRAGNRRANRARAEGPRAEFISPILEKIRIHRVEHQRALKIVKFRLSCEKNYLLISRNTLCWLSEKVARLTTVRC